MNIIYSESMYVMNAHKIDTFELCDNWGFYIDIECNPITFDNAEMMRQKYKIKKMFVDNKFIKKNYRDYKGEHIETIYEEYEFHCKNNKADDILFITNSIDKKDVKNEKITAMIMKVSSTTLITILLTYFIYFVI